jgi:hypothetical protein
MPLRSCIRATTPPELFTIEPLKNLADELLRSAVLAI